MVQLGFRFRALTTLATKSRHDLMACARSLEDDDGARRRVCVRARSAFGLVPTICSAPYKRAQPVRLVRTTRAIGWRKVAGSIGKDSRQKHDAHKRHEIPLDRMHFHFPR